MAVELALGLLGPVIELGKLVGRPIGRQFNYLCCFTSNIDSLKDEAKKLDDALKGLEEEVKSKSNNLEEPVGEVKTWIQNSKEIKEVINGILSEATSAESGCSKLGARFNLSKRAKKTTDSTGLFLGQKPKAEFQSGPIAAAQAVQLGKTFECESRKTVEEGIMATLRGGDLNMIGICGMGGLGKTTMAKKIINRVLYEGVFDEVVMAVVSQNVEISTIQDKIGRPLGLEKLKEENSDTVRKQLLHARLSNTKRTLLVLDDVWEKLELHDFGIPCDSKACRILLTSRDKDVLDLMEVQVFGMKVLPEEEAFSFFREIVGTRVDKTYLKPIAKKIVKKCSGLMIALKLVGEALKHKDKAPIWKDALRDMEQCDPNGVMKKVYLPLKWSYDFLSSENEGLYAQSLFLLCCLFPEDAEIPLEYLTYFCMGLGNIEGITKLEDARNKMAKLTEILKSRSLLLDSEDENHVRMHDVVRDACIYIAKEERRIGGNDCTWISSSQLVGNRNELLSGSRFPNLHLLFFSRRYDSLEFKFEGALLEEIRELYVLCIENYSFTKLPCPTQSLGKLNTLILDSCEQLETISIVGELVHLEILICRACGSITELPSEMRGLNHLKLLELTRCRNLRSIGRGIISSLVQLEELKMRDSFKQWESEDREEKEHAGLRELEALKNLTWLEIEIEDPALAAENMILSSKIEKFRITIGAYYSPPSEFDKEIRLRLERETRLEDWIEMQLLRNAECLRLIGNVDLERGDNIKWLELKFCESVKNVVRTSMFDDAPMFPSIEHLKLHDLPQLEEICYGPISSCSFQNLNKLQLENCEALTHFWRSSNHLRQNNSVPLFTNLSSISIWNCDGLLNLGQLSIAGKDCLPQLEDISIGSCKMMEQVFLWNDEGADESKSSIGSQQNRHVTKVFPKLKEVKLYYLPNLTTFYKGIEGIEFPSGMEMEIIECPNMKGIIGTSNNADIDPSLAAENMRLSSKIERFCITIGEDQLELSKFNKEIRLCLEGETLLGDWIGMQFMRNAERLRLGGDYVDFGRGDNIKCLELVKCENVKNVVRTSQFDNAPMFTSIEHLELYRLPQLEEICDGPISSGSFQNLKKLQLFNCEALTHFWRSSNLRQNNNLPLFTNLSSISIWNCGLRNLGQLSIAGKDCLPQLEDLDIGRCKMMEQVFLWNNEGADESKNSIGSQQNRHVTKVFPKLKLVNLDDLPNLTTFYKGIEGIEFPLGMEMEIIECPKMKGIIGSSNNADIDHQYSHLFCQSGQLELSLIGSHKVLDVDHDPLGRHEIPPSLFNGLEVLTIKKYESRSKSVFTLSMARNLVSLTDLCISKSDEMIRVIEDEAVASGGERILLFPKLEKLRLIKLSKLESFCEWKCEVELPSLKKVQIKRCPCIMEDFISLGVAPNLEVFKTDLTTYVGVGIGISFDSVKELEIKWNNNPFYDYKISVSLFSGLEKLKFYRFKPEGMSLFSCSVAENLVNLRELYIYICERILVNIIEDGEAVNDDEKVASIVLFPKLEKLKLHELPQLVSFCEWKCNAELPSLRKVTIVQCPKMEKFSSGFLATPNLEMVEIEYDSADIGARKDLNRVLHQHYLVREKLPSSNLNDLDIDYNPFHGHEIPSSVCDGLEVLRINKYEGSMSFFTLSMARNLVGLKELCISECDEMIRVIEDEAVASGGERILLFPKLEKLQLKILPKLVTFCELKCEVELPSLKKVQIKRCPCIMEDFISLGVAPNLEVFKTDLTTYVGVGIGISFDSVKELVIQWNNNPFYDHKISVSLFSGLEKLKLYRFKPEGMSLFSCSVAENLVNLRELDIITCERILVNIIEDGEAVNDDEKVASIVLFPKLEKLKLHELPQLVSLCEWKCNVELPSLREVYIEDCLNLEKFSSGFLATPNLEMVKIERDYADIGATKDLNRVLHQHYLVRKSYPPAA